MTAVEHGTVEEREAVEAILRELRQRAREGDAARAAALYADDADWMNAFGVRRRGRVEIEAWLRRLNESPGYRAGQVTHSTPEEIQFLRPDLAVVHRYLEISGQRSAAGTELPVRRTHHLLVLSKESGRWVIACHYIMDERDRPA